MDCTQVLVESDEEDNVAEEDDRRQVASLIVNEDSFPIFLGENKIGRDASTCSVVITSLALSSQHAVIQGLECGMFLIRDLNSRNKTKIGKMTLTPNVRYQLKSGDVVRFANVSCTFHVERDVRSNSTSSEKDIPCTQAFEGSDHEDEAGCSNEQDVPSNKKMLVKDDPDGNRDGVKTPKSTGKKSEEHLFKIPAVTPTRNINDSFGLLNDSKNSSCHVDSDDEIFELLTQPSSGEPATSELVTNNDGNDVKGQESENVSPSGAEIEMADDDDIFSAATEDCNVAHKEKGSALTVAKETGDKDSDASDDGVFSAATEGFQPDYHKTKKVSGVSSKTSEIKGSNDLKEDEANDKEDIFSACTEGFNVKTPKDTHEAGGMVKKDDDAWEEYGIADEDDIFSAATEALPAQSSETKVLKTKSKDAVSKAGNAPVEGEITDEEDIFSAATEALPPVQSRDQASKSNSRNAIAKDGVAHREGDATDEDDLFSAATEAPPAKSSEKKVLKTKSKDAVAKAGNASGEGDITDEEDIFSADTEAFPALQSLKKACKKNSRNAGEVDKDGDITDEEDIFSAATEALPCQSSKKKILNTKSKQDVNNVHGGTEEDDVTDEEDIFSAATEALPALQSKKKACKTNSSDAVAKDGDGDKEGDVTDEEGIFSAATEAIPVSNDGQNNESGSSMSKVVDMKGMQGKRGNCEDDGFVKDFLSNSNSEHVGKGGDGPTVGNREGKQAESETDALEMKSSMENDGEETDVEDDIDSYAKDKRTEPQSVLKNVVNESEKSKCDNSVAHKIIVKSASEHGLDGDGGSYLNDPNASIVVISDTDGEDEEESNVDSTLEKSEKDKTVESSAIKSNNSGSFTTVETAQCDTLASKDLHETRLDQQSGNVTKTVMMTIDETLPTASVILTSKGSKTFEGSSVGNNTTGNKYSKVEKPDVQGHIASKSSVKSTMGDVCDKNPVSAPESVQNQSNIVTDKDEDEVFVAETPVCDRNVKRKMGHQVSPVKDVEEEEDMSSFLTEAPPVFDTPVVGMKRMTSGVEDISDFEIQSTPKPSVPCISRKEKGMIEGEDEEEDMSSFLTEVPPEFKTPLFGLKRTSSGINDRSDFKIQSTPKSSVPCISGKEKGVVGDDDEEEDMSSFLTQAPPEFKTPESAVKKLGTGEDDLSELLTQPAPISGDIHTPAKGNDEEDMSSFLTEAPPEFKTPVTGVQKILAEEEDDLSDLATQPAPNSSEKEQGNEDEDMSSFLTEAPPDFKTPVAGVRKIKIIDEEEDFSDLATQPAPQNVEKERENKAEDMSPCLTKTLPEFKTPVAGVRKIDADEEDISNLMTQPAPRDEEKEQELNERETSSLHKKVPLDFKTQMAGIQKITVDKDDDLSNVETQPSPKSVEQEQGSEKKITKTLPNEAKPEFKTPKVAAQKCVEEEEEDWSDFATQPAPVIGEKHEEEEVEDKKSSPKAESEFKIPKAFGHNVSSEKEQDEDFSEMATQPAPTCDEKVGEDNKLADAPSKSKATKGDIHNISSEGEDFSDLATQPAPVSEEEHENVVEMNLRSPKTSIKPKTLDMQERSVAEEDDMSELLTQPAPGEGILHSKSVSEKMGDKERALSLARRKGDQTTQSTESGEEDLSLLDTQPAPTSPEPDDSCNEQRKRPPTVDQIRKEDKSKGKESGAARHKENLTSLRGKNLKNIESPKKVCHSPRGGRKAVNIFADLKSQTEEEDSSDTDFEFSMALPDTPDLIATLQESGNRYVPIENACRNLFDNEQPGETADVPSTTSSKSVSKSNRNASKGPGRKNDDAREEQIRTDAVKVSAQSKSTPNVKNTTCPPKKPKDVQKEPGHLDVKRKGVVSDSKCFDSKTGVTMAGLNDMQNIKSAKLVNSKSKTSMLREVVVTSTPIQSSVVAAESDETPSPGCGANAAREKTTKPSRRGRRKGGAGKSDAGRVAKDIISPVVCVSDASDMPSSIKIEDFPATRTDASKKAHNLRLKKSSDSSVSVKAGVKRIKEQELNLRVNELIGSSEGKTLRGGRKKNIPSPVEEVAPVTKVSSKSRKGRKKIDSDTASSISGGDIPQPAECPDKLKTSNESNKGRDYRLGETSESSNVDGELSPVIFYGKNTKTEKSENVAVSIADLPVVALSKKKPLANDSQSEEENRDTSVVSPESVRRSVRERKPKKRFSVDISPIKPKRNKSDLQSLKSIPAGERTGRVKKGFADTNAHSDSGMNSSQETAVSSDSTLIVSRKRASDDQQSLRSHKKLRISDVDSPVKVATRGGSRQRDERGLSTSKGSMGPPAAKSDYKSKLTDGNVLGSQKGPTVTLRDIGDIQEVQEVKGGDGGDKDSSKRKRKKDPEIPEKPLRASTRSRGDEEASDAKSVRDQQGCGIGGRLRAKEGSSSEKSRVVIAKETNLQVNQERSLRGRNAAIVEKSKGGRNESTDANSSKMSSNSVTIVVDEESKDEKPKKTVGSRNSSTTRNRRRKLSPVTVDKNDKEDKDIVENDEHLQPPKVAPLRISRGRIVPGSTKGSDDVTVDSPVYNKSLLGECVLEEQPSSRVSRKQKKDFVNVLFTGLSDPKLNQIVERLGGSIVETPQSCTVLVTDRLRRTYKLLCAIGRGIPIVTTQWLTQSSSSNKFLDPFDFLVCDKVTEKRFNFTLKSSLEKARAKPLLSGFNFIATPSVKPPPEEVKGIVTCAGGQYVSTLKALESKMSPLCYVVSCAEDSGVWDEYTEIGTKKAPRGRGQRGKGASSKEERPQAKLLGVEGLLVSVLRQKPDLENNEFSLR